MNRKKIRENWEAQARQFLCKRRNNKVNSTAKLWNNFIRMIPYNVIVTCGISESM